MKTLITVNRPNGTTEIIDVTSRVGVNPPSALKRQMESATRNAGRGEIVKWEQVDDRSEADKAYSEVLAARAAVSSAESARYHDPARICAARKAADQAEADWARQYPEAAAAKRRAAQASAQRKADALTSGPRYNAIMTMSD